jgi:hypothetical protein
MFEPMFVTDLEVCFLNKLSIFFTLYYNCPLTGAGQQQGDSDEGGAADDNDDDVEAAADDLFNDPKLGAKKRAKMEMKAEKKAMREVKFIKKISSRAV